MTGSRQQSAHAQASGGISKYDYPAKMFTSFPYSSEEWFQNRMQHRQQNHPTYSEMAGRPFQTDHRGPSPYRPPFPRGGGAGAGGLYPKLDQDEVENAGDRFSTNDKFQRHHESRYGHHGGDRRFVRRFWN